MAIAMSSGVNSLDALVEAGTQAMQRRDFTRAREIFERITVLAPRDRRGFFALAMANRDAGNLTAAQAALDAMLKLNPSDLPALMLKGDINWQDGDEKAAATFYGVVCKLSPESKKLPPDAASEVRRALDRYNHFSAKTLTQIKSDLASAGYDETSVSRRFSESIEILAGTKRRYIEEPRGFYFSGLPALGRYPREMFPWLEALEDQTAVIAQEFAEAIAMSDEFIPYVRAEDNRPTRYDHRLLDNMEWSALFLCDDGKTNESVARRFPKTLAALAKTPLHIIENKGPMILFSRLAPGAHIAPHSGFLNTRLICHLPIITPGDCALRVGNDLHQWKRGEAIVFNDTIEHEAWNNSDKYRIILLFSIWRPELTDEERRLVSALMRSAHGFAGGGA